MRGTHVDSRLFVAKVFPSELNDTSWLTRRTRPFKLVHPLDFAQGADIQAVFKIYKQAYSKLGPLNVPILEEFLEYNRWVLIVDIKYMITGFAAFKTSPPGIKLCLIASNRTEIATAAVKKLIRNGLNVDGVYSEVSHGVENVCAGHVPEVSPALAERVLQKSVELDSDGRHYFREITNVGRKRKLLVGKPLLRTPADEPLEEMTSQREEAALIEELSKLGEFENILRLQRGRNAFIKEFSKLGEFEKILIIERIGLNKQWANVIKHPLVLGHLNAGKTESQIRQARRIMMRAILRLKDGLSNRGF